MRLKWSIIITFEYGGSPWLGRRRAPHANPTRQETERNPAVSREQCGFFHERQAAPSRLIVRAARIDKAVRVSGNAKIVEPLEVFCLMNKRPIYAMCAILLAVAVGFPLPASGEPFDPAAIFLTWRGDPTTTMVIDWHVLPGDEVYRFRDRNIRLDYRPSGEGEWTTVMGSDHNFPHSDRVIYRVELSDLEPGGTYDFRFAEDGRAYQFRTMPDQISESEPLRFAVGGDTDDGERFRRMNRAVMNYAHDVEFVLWGGDLPYANGDPINIGMWYTWFDDIKETLIDDDGRVIPIVVAIGNHEVFQRERLIGGKSPHPDHTEEEADRYMEAFNLVDGYPTFFNHLFAFPEETHGVLDFADYMSLFILDSDHYIPIEGEQTQWLEQALAERTDQRYLFPIYHFPAYPSHRPMDISTSVAVREHWVPLFEEFGVKVAFENHDHNYKRTYPIRNNEISEDGVVYVGDGAWGRRLKSGNQQDAWYIEKFVSDHHGVIVTIDGERKHFDVWGIGEESIDSFTVE